MIALETYDRDREPDTPTFTQGVTLADIAELPERCGTDLDAILESEEALVEMGALGKNHAVGPWWDRIRQVYTLLNQRELPPWAEAQTLPKVRHLLHKSRTKRARTELPPQCKNCGGTVFRMGGPGAASRAADAFLTLHGLQ